MSEPSGNRQVATGSYQAQVIGDHNTTTIGDVTNITYRDVDPRPVDAGTLQDALRQLDRLPLDEVPAPAPLPHGSHMTLAPNPLFVGRVEQLKSLARSLKAGDADSAWRVVTVAATGVGGVGKSQLACEFVHRYGQFFEGGVFWLSFADPDTIAAEVVACGSSGSSELGSDFVALPFEYQVRRVLSAWQGPLPRLLVFDNCEDEELLQQWRPPTGGCRVLVTSRREQWNATLGVLHLPIDVLSREEGVALLRKHRPDLRSEDSHLDAIAEELGDLPLALELAGSYLARYRPVVTLDEYVAKLQSPELLEDRSLRGTKGNISPTGHMLDVGKTLALSFERLDPDPLDPSDEQDVKHLARKLLARAARFAPGEPIPHELLFPTLDLPDGDPDQLLLAEDALLRLREFSLLKGHQEDTFRMHRLVAAFVRGVTAEAEAQEAVENALVEAVSPLIEESPPAKISILLPHLREVTDAANVREDEQAARLCNSLGLCLGKMGAYAEAHPYLTRAVTICGKVLGEEHPETARTLNDLANLLRVEAHYVEARALYERALAIRKKALGEEHPETARTLNDLAMLLRIEAHYAEARTLYERALGILQKAFGEQHLETSRVLNNLAMVLWNLGRYVEARPLYERALAIRKKALGEEHPETARILKNLADLLRDQGRYAEARPLYERALAIRRKALGEEHPETALTLSNLAKLLWMQGRCDEAQPLLEQVLAIRKRVYGEEHPYTARTLHFLANVLRDQGRYAEAQTLYERTSGIFKKTLDEQHPDIAMNLNSFATLLQNQGRYDEARTLYEQALAIYEARLGLTHPRTEQIRKNLSKLPSRRRA